MTYPETWQRLNTLYLFNVMPFLIYFSAAVEQVFKIGSMEPGAMLFDASKEFEVGDDSFIVFSHSPN